MKNLLVLVLILISLVGKLSAQTLTPPSSIMISYQIDTAVNLTVDPILLDSVTMSTVPHTINIIVVLDDTSLIANTNVQVINGGQVLFNEQIPFSSLTTIQGATYECIREENVLYVTLQGSYTGVFSSVAQVTTEDSSGNVSPTVTSQ